jgi:hypothetical protein
MKPNIQLRYCEYKKQKELGDKIKKHFEKMFTLDGQRELEMRVLCNL